MFIPNSLQRGAAGCCGFRLEKCKVFRDRFVPEYVIDPTTLAPVTIACDHVACDPLTRSKYSLLKNIQTGLIPKIVWEYIHLNGWASRFARTSSPDLILRNPDKWPEPHDWIWNPRDTPGSGADNQDEQIYPSPLPYKKRPLAEGETENPDVQEKRLKVYYGTPDNMKAADPNAPKRVFIYMKRLSFYINFDMLEVPNLTKQLVRFWLSSGNDKERILKCIDEILRTVDYYDTARLTKNIPSKSVPIPSLPQPPISE
jgi:hypothetical protein